MGIRSRNEKIQSSRRGYFIPVIMIERKYHKNTILSNFSTYIIQTVFQSRTIEDDNNQESYSRSEELL